MSKKRIVITVSIILALVVIYNLTSADESQKNLYHKVKKGDLEVNVVTSGELKAINSVKIKGPSSVQTFGIYNMKVSKILDEGTLVKKGEWVAELDASELVSKLKTAMDELQKAESQMQQKRIDTAISLSDNREQLRNIGYTLQEKKINLEQSKFEPPATVRLAQMELEQAQIKSEKEQENYELNVRKSKAEMRVANADLNIAKTKVDKIQNIIDQFTIYAPEDGMLNYAVHWTGEKIKSGSQINAWNPIVAELPDLNKMVSITYVNEVDIRKISDSLRVEVTLDAFPEKKLFGTVIRVANMGEELNNSDAKVFAVEIVLDEVSNDILPGMTTGNKIMTQRKEDVVNVPIESIYSEGDSLFYVYRKSGLSEEKVEVKKGLYNENYVEITNGLNIDDLILLTEPEDPESLNIVLLGDD